MGAVHCRRPACADAPKVDSPAATLRAALDDAFGIKPALHGFQDPHRIVRCNLPPICAVRFG